VWLSNWTGSAWTRVLHEKFLYDGWNLLGAFNGTNAAIIRSFLWGLDLSGSMQGAGGVGGLIAFRQHSGSLAGSHFPAYDGNGNVMALVDGKTGSTSARYEYDPFGQTIRASGTMATVNPVRFSSKVVDDETDYAYYGYRYLNPNSGRWLNRDLIEEEGGANVFGFAGNNSVIHFDLLGNDFIAVAGRPVSGIAPGNHYSIQYWLSCGQESPDYETPIYLWLRNHPARKLGSVELLASGGWVADRLSVPWTAHRVSVSVAVISIGPNNFDSGSRFVSVFTGTPAEVRNRWRTILHLAQNYGFAEQGGLAFSGPFNNWPNSKYGLPWDLPFNNSNTFVRDTIRWAGLTMRELSGDGLGGYPGNNSPVPVTASYLGDPVRP
jgi:RHS repeat-associated protein